MRQSVPITGLVGAAAFWGVAITATKYAVGRLHPLVLLSVELLAATTALWLVVALRARVRPTRRCAIPWRQAAVLGACEPCLAYAGEALGLTRTDAGNAAVLSGLESTFVVLLAALVLGKRITPSLGIVVGVGLLGALALERVDGLSLPDSGDLLVLLGTLSAAAYTIVACRLDEDGDPIGTTARQFTVATAVIIPATLVTVAVHGTRLPTDVPSRFWLAAVLIGIIGFAASFLIYNWAITSVDARTAAVIINLIPVFGLASAVCWLGDALSIDRVVGAALIILSVAVYTRAELTAAAPSVPAAGDRPAPGSLRGNAPRPRGPDGAAGRTRAPRRGGRC